MENKNQIVASDWFTKPMEVVSKLTIDETGFNWALIDKLESVKKLLRDKLLKSTINKMEIILPNGEKKVITISRGGETLRTTKNKIIDLDKAIEYAKQNNLHLPMTERIIIEPQVDKSKIENELWFQENVDKFVLEKEETKKVKSFDRILIKDFKE